MKPQSENIKAAADGLLYMSESDAPFVTVELSATSRAEAEAQLKHLCGKGPEAVVETQTVDYFFRNQIKEYPTDTAEQKKRVSRFAALKQALNDNLSDLTVYRIGAVQVDAFVIGRLSDGTYAGLWTKLVET